MDGLGRTGITTLRERLQTALGGAYTIERELGGGGMSCVFVALDARLGRRVVVKVLAPDLAVGVSAQRFEREVRLAARLQHPHVVPLLSAGDVEGLPYYTMPFVDGESLRQRLVREGALSVPDAIRLVRELADALAYAHGQAVVHRDLKPENVLLSGGHAVVTDFGVAKALASATHDVRRSDGSGLPGAGPTAGVTGLGVAVGTPAYMAPEQAAGDPATDHRADLYALGLIAYEALAGRHPFGGRAPQAMLAAHLTETPAPLGTRRSDAPPHLAALVTRLLAKAPVDRPPSAMAVLAALDAADDESPPVHAPGRPARRGRRWWSRVVAVTALATTAGVAAVVAPRIRAVGEHETAIPPDGLVVADFEDQSGDSTLARTVTQALRVDLARSPRIALPSAAEVRQGLARMRADTATVLTGDLALELARRVGGKAALEGAVGRAGTGFVLTARLAATADGQTVATFRETAADSTGVIAAIDRLSHAVRAAVGESMAALRASPPMSMSTTGSLPALTAYTAMIAAWEEADWVQALEHAREAVALDPDFAEAHRRIGIALGNLGIRRGERLEALTRAYALRGRLSRREQGMIEASYYSSVLGDHRRAAARYRALIAEFPRAAHPARWASVQNNLYNAYTNLGEWERAARTIRALADSAPTTQVSRANLIEGLVGAGQLAAADSVVRAMERAHPGQPSVVWSRTWIAMARRDYAGALALVDSALDAVAATPSARVQLLASRRTATAVLGRLGARERADAELRTEYERLDARPEMLAVAADLAAVEAALGLEERATRRLDAALERYPLGAMTALDRPYPALAIAWATAGQPTRAEVLLREWARVVPTEHQPLDAVPVLRARIVILLAQGRGLDAERLARAGDFGACDACRDLYLARAFDAQGAADSTRSAYERYLAATAGRDRLDPTELARAYRRLGELYEARGDVRRAVQRYGDFLTVWQDADGALQAALADVRERINRLQARVG